MGEKTSEVIYLGYTTALDYDVNGNLIYFGKADKGASKAAAQWSIIKMTYDMNSLITDIQWADGNGLFDNIWNDRAVLSYV